MAMMDRMRERMRGQRPVGAAESMVRGGMPATPQENAEEQDL